MYKRFLFLFILLTILFVIKSVPATATTNEFLYYYNDLEGESKTGLTASAYNIVNFEGNNVLRNMRKYDNENILSSEDVPFENYSFEFKIMNHNTLPLPSPATELNFISIAFGIEGFFTKYYELQIDYSFETATLYQVTGASAESRKQLFSREIDVNYHQWHTYKVDVYKQGYELSLDGQKIVMGVSEQSIVGKFGIRTQKSLVSIDDIKLSEIKMNNLHRVIYQYDHYDIESDTLVYNLELWIPKKKLEQYSDQTISIKSYDHELNEGKVYSHQDLMIRSDGYQDQSINYYIYTYSVLVEGNLFSAVDEIKLITEVNNQKLYYFGIVEVSPKTPKAWVTYQTKADLEISFEDVGAISYDIYRSISPNSNFSKIISDTKERVFHNANLTHDTTYYYKIIAKYKLNDKIIESTQETPYAFTPTKSDYNDSGKEGYVLNWSDEFNSGSLDTSVWAYREDTKGGGSSKEQVSVSNGNLVISGKAYTDVNGRKSGMGGGVITKFGFGYGYYEAKIKLDVGQFWHPAFWTSQSYSFNNEELFYQNRVEIDIMEFDRVNWKGSYKTNLINWSPTTGGTSYQHREPSDLRESYYIWGLEYTPERINFYLDGYLIQTIDTHNVPFAKQNIWLTMIHITEEHTGENPDPNSKMYVDYFRYYTHENGIPQERLSKTEFTHHGDTFIINDDFRSYSPSQNWSLTDNIRVLEGQYKLNQDGFEEDGKTTNITFFARDIGNQNSLSGLAHYQNTNLFNYTVSANVRTHSIIGETTLKAPNGTKNGIVGRLQDKNNFYYLQLDWNRNCLNLWLIKDGVSSLLGSKPIYGELKTFNWYNLGLRFYENQITAYFENQEFFSVNDQTFSSGTAGVRNELQLVSFDDFQVSEFVENESISIVESNIEMSVGEKKPLTIQFYPQNTTDKEITWKIKDSSIISVNENNELIALGIGTTELIAYSQSGKKAILSVTVKEAGYSGPFIEIPSKIELTYRNSIPNDLSNFVTNLDLLSDLGVEITIEGEVNPYQYGTYPVTFSVTNGMESMSLIVNFIVVDNESPQVNSVSTIVMEKTEQVNWKNYLQITDNADEEVKVEVLSRSFNSDQIGDYLVTLILSDRSGNQTKLENVHIDVIESTGPKFTVCDHYYFIKGSELNLNHLLSFDQDYDPTLIINVIGTYDINKVGTYQIEIEVKDRLGRIVRKPSTIHVREDASPIIDGPSMIEISIHSPEPDWYKGMTIVDLNGNDLTFTLDKTNLNLSKAGIYSVIYKAKDETNRESQYVVEVKVVQSISIVIEQPKINTMWPIYVFPPIILFLCSTFAVCIIKRKR